MGQVEKALKNRGLPRQVATFWSAAFFSISINGEKECLKKRLVLILDKIGAFFIQNLFKFYPSRFFSILSKCKSARLRFLKTRTQKKICRRKRSEQNSDTGKSKNGILKSREKLMSKKGIKLDSILSLFYPKLDFQPLAKPAEPLQKFLTPEKSSAHAYPAHIGAHFRTLFYFRFERIYFSKPATPDFENARLANQK